MQDQLGSPFLLKKLSLAKPQSFTSQNVKLTVSWAESRTINFIYLW